MVRGVSGGWERDGVRGHECRFHDTPSRSTESSAPGASALLTSRVVVMTGTANCVVSASNSRCSSTLLPVPNGPATTSGL